MLTARVLTILFLLGLVWSVGSLLLLTWRRRRLDRSAPPASKPTREANRWIRLLAAAVLLPALGLLGMHSYWALFADRDEGFLRVQRRRDARQRRIEESGLRGWILDRHQQAASSLAGYRMKREEMVRTYPLAEAAAHVIGYSSLLRGNAGAELAYASRLRSSLSRGRLFSGKAVVGDDVTLTLDRALQQVAAEQLRRAGKPGAVVVLDVLSGDVLAMASFPTFDPHHVASDAVWSQLLQDASQPLVNRALNQYYLPGSSFKVVVAASALELGERIPEFFCSSQGFLPPGSHRPIFDDRGPSEFHRRIGLARALRVSCNQYFAQLGLRLGYQRLARTAERFGFHVDRTPEQARQRRIDDQAWSNRDEAFGRVFGPHTSRLVLSEQTTPLDLSYETYGQGFVQVTPLQMALVAAAIAHGGRLMAARLDHLTPPRARGRSMVAANAERLRDMLQGVTDEPGGTAFRAFSPLRAEGLHSAGKTGTAQFRQGAGRRVDSWFIGFAPADQPRIAYAVVVEGGGYGSQLAAPMAATIVEAALRTGLLAEPPALGEHQAALGADR